MTYLFDNNLGQALATALRTLGKPTMHVREISELGGAAPDDLILQYAGQWNHVLMTRDRALTRTPQYRGIITAKQVGVVVYQAGKARQMGAWEITKLVVKSWDDMERFVASTSRPFIAFVSASGRIRV